jgi:hypothetical protein
MKKILTAAIAVLSLNSFANTVYLDSSRVDLGANQATLEKTASTPETVNLKVTVPTKIERCDEVDMRVQRTTVTSGARCGYETVVVSCNGYDTGYYPNTRPRYRAPRTGRVSRRGSRYNPPVGGRTSVYAGRRYRNGGFNRHTCVRTIAKTCTVNEIYCSNPQYVTVDKVKNFKLFFNRFNKEASIKFSLDQENNLELKVLNIKSSCLKTKVFVNGSEKTGAEIKLKRRCR